MSAFVGGTGRRRARVEAARRRRPIHRDPVYVVPRWEGRRRPVRGVGRAVDALDQLHVVLDRPEVGGRVGGEVGGVEEVGPCLVAVAQRRVLEAQRRLKRDRFLDQHRVGRHHGRDLLHLAPRLHVGHRLGACQTAEQIVGRVRRVIVVHPLEWTDRGRGGRFRRSLEILVDPREVARLLGRRRRRGRGRDGRDPVRAREPVDHRRHRATRVVRRAPVRRAALRPRVHVHHRLRGRLLKEKHRCQPSILSIFPSIEKRNIFVYIIRYLFHPRFGHFRGTFLRGGSFGARSASGRRLAALVGGRFARLGRGGRRVVGGSVLGIGPRRVPRPLGRVRVRLAVGQASGQSQLAGGDRGGRRGQLGRHLVPLRASLLLGAHHLRPQRPPAPHHQLDHQLRLLQPPHAIQPSHVRHRHAVYREHLEKGGAEMRRESRIISEEG